MRLNTRRVYGAIRAIVAWGAGLGLVVVVAMPVAIATRCLVAAPSSMPSVEDPPELRAAKAPIAGFYGRQPGATYLSLPEWSVAYSAADYAALIRAGRPSAFPYLAAIEDYWGYYTGVCSAACGAVPFDPGNHAMAGLLGAEFTVESILKSVYESSIGRATEVLSSTDTDEDRYAAAAAEDYARFLTTAPWYDYSFKDALVGLWKTPMTGAHPLRKWERRAALSTEYAVKTIYAWIVRAAAGSDAPEARRTYVVVDRLPATIGDKDVRKIAAAGPGRWILSLPRYDAFTPAAVALVSAGARFVEIAGNRRILVTAISDDGKRVAEGPGRLLFARELPGNARRRRLAIDADVGALGDLVAALGRSGASLEHIYDY